MRLLFFLLIVSLSGCSVLSKKSLTREMREGEKEFQHHAGIYVVDPERKKTIFEYQSDRYFTPASNTKILTFFTSLTLLGDSIPGLRYVERGDSLIFWGTGDPSFLYPETFNNGRVFNFLSSSRKNLYFSSGNFFTTHFGPGWAWDDYNDYYSSERSPFPVYGNSFGVYPLPDQALVIPSFFRKFYKIGPRRNTVQVGRELNSNSFTYYPGIKKTSKQFFIPFRTDSVFVCELLTDLVGKTVKPVSQKLPQNAKTIYSIPSDSLYSVMMKESDNHIAEQLLLMCSAVISDSLKPEIAIRYMQRAYFSNFSDNAVWKDGSGLSRYNLFTPRFIGELWQEIYKKVPRERLFALLATGGEHGTLEKLFSNAKQPYVFGKTGTLSNNHCISGYLLTKKGKVLVFAFMNSNYTSPVKEIRRYMQKILNLYYENY